jgi:hypothetical protein
VTTSDDAQRAMPLMPPGPLKLSHALAEKISNIACIVAHRVIADGSALRR